MTTTPLVLLCTSASSQRRIMGLCLLKRRIDTPEAGIISRKIVLFQECCYRFLVDFPHFASLPPLGRMALATPKQMNFWKSSSRAGEGGCWVMFNQKIYVVDFGPFNRAFWAWNWYRICNIIFRKFIRFGVAILPKGGKEAKWGKSTRKR